MYNDNMRVIIRLDAYPPEFEGADEGGMFATMIGEVRRFIEQNYESWGPCLTTIVGYEDNDGEAATLLQEKWVARA